MDIIRKALLVFVLSLSLPAAALLAQTVVSRADAAAELLACLKVLGGDKAAFASGTHKFQVSRAGASAPMFKAQLGNGRLTGFECKKFTAEVTKSGGPLKFKHKDGKEGRVFTDVDRHALRGWLSLDPYWVLEEVSSRLNDFQVALSQSGEMVFFRRGFVPLGDAADQIYGKVDEMLVLMPATHEVALYSVVAEVPGGTATTDLYNQYDYSKTKGSDKAITVSHGSNFRQAGCTLEVRYQGQ